MKVFEYDGIQLKYKVIGEKGPVYLLLHGFGGGPEDWSNITAQLASTHRVVTPNLKVFYSHVKPFTFSAQVNFLNFFVEYLLNKKNVKALKLMGQSYGATLSIALRLNKAWPLLSHTVLNPMSFHPVESIQNPHLKALAQLGHMPGAANRFLSSESGRQCLSILAHVFRIGAFGHHDISHVNERKLLLIEKAIERFLWIDEHEDWAKWESVLKALPNNFIDHYFYSSADSLFSATNYKNLAIKLKAKNVTECIHEGHLLIQDEGKNLLPKIIT